MLARTGASTVASTCRWTGGSTPETVSCSPPSTRTTKAATRGDGRSPSIVPPDCQGERTSIRGVASNLLTSVRPWSSTDAGGPRSTTTIELSLSNSRTAISWALLLGVPLTNAVWKSRSCSRSRPSRASRPTARAQIATVSFECRATNSAMRWNVREPLEAFRSGVIRSALSSQSARSSAGERRFAL